MRRAYSGICGPGLASVTNWLYRNAVVRWGIVRVVAGDRLRVHFGKNSQDAPLNAESAGPVDSSGWSIGSLSRRPSVRGLPTFTDGGLERSNGLSRTWLSIPWVLLRQEPILGGG